MTASKFVVESDSSVGKHILANQDFNVGDIILEDESIIAGSGHKTEPVCINCLIVLQNDFQNAQTQCVKCGWPLCHQCYAQTSDLFFKLHSNEECHILSTCTKDLPPHPYQVIMPLRLGIEATKDSWTWKQFENLMDHEMDRKKNEEEWNMFDNEVVQYIIQGFKAIGIQVTAQLIHKCIGIICVNSISIDLQIPEETKGRRKGRVLFPFACLANHSCDNNAAYSVNPSTLRLTMKARTSIRSNEQITISYVPMIVGNPLRSFHIKNEWFFECRCTRCCDNTDHRSMISAIICSQCNLPENDGSTPGLLLPNSKSAESSWSCCQCGGSKSSQEILQLVSGIEKELRDLCHGRASSENLQLFEDFISKNRGILHPNHFLFLIAKRNLISQLTIFQQNLLSKINKNQELFLSNTGTKNLKDDSEQNRDQERRNEALITILKKKLQLCEQILPVIKQLDSSHSEWLGFLYQELALTSSQLRKLTKTCGNVQTFAAMTSHWLREAQICKNIFGQFF